jgi:hypothetical protein
VQLEEAKVAEISIQVAKGIVVGLVPELNVFNVARMKCQIGDRLLLVDVDGIGSSRSIVRERDVEPSAYWDRFSGGDTDEILFGIGSIRLHVASQCAAQRPSRIDHGEVLPLARRPIAEQDLSRRRGRGQSQRESECEALRLDVEVRDVEKSGVADLDVSPFELAAGRILECEPSVTADDDRRANLVGGDVVQGAVECHTNIGIKCGGPKKRFKREKRASLKVSRRHLD